MKQILAGGIAAMILASCATPQSRQAVGQDGNRARTPMCYHSVFERSSDTSEHFPADAWFNNSAAGVGGASPC